MKRNRPVGLCLSLALGASLLLWNAASASEANVSFRGDIKGITGKHVYRLGDRVIISVDSTTSGKTRFIYRITDFFGRVVDRGDRQLASSGNATGRVEISYLPRATGVFYLDYRIEDKKGRASFSVVPAARPRPADAPFGICFAIPDMMEMAGLKWNRSDFTWSVIEPQRGTFDWSFPDSLVANAEKHGYRMMPILDYSAPWASTAPPGTPDDRSIFYPPVLADWSDYITAVVSRYKGRVKYWEVWNEPDVSHVLFKDGTPEQYAEVLKTAYLAAKKADPDCKIVGCGGVNPRSLGFLESVFKAGGVRYMDILSLHPYRPAMGSPEGTDFLTEMATLKRLFDQYGGANMPIWFTEFQWPADDLDPDHAKFLGECFDRIVTEKRQADYLARFYVQSLSLGYVTNHFWFTMKHPSPSLAVSVDSAAGLMRQDNTLKPSYLAHRTLSDLLSNSAPTKSTDLGALKAYTFRGPNGNEVTAIWNTDGRQIAVLEVPGKKLGITDLMGNKKEVTLKRRLYMLEVSETPLFLIGGDIRLTGSVMNVDWGEDNVISAMEPKRVRVSISNPTGGPMAGTLTVSSPDIKAGPGKVAVSLKSGQTRRAEILLSPGGFGSGGKADLTLSFDQKTPCRVKLIRKKRMLIYSKVILNESFEGDIEHWRTNADEKHVVYNTVEKSEKYAHEGKYSLNWKCKSGLWNTIFWGFPRGIDPEARAIEFWVYLDKPPTGSKRISPLIIESGGAQYGYFDKLELPMPGQWRRYVVPTADLQKGVGADEDGRLTLNGPFDLCFNYTNGELEAYIDDIRLLK